MALAPSSRRSKRIFDKDTELKASGAVTSVGANAETGIELAVRKDEEFKAVVVVTAFDIGNADETYSVAIEVSDVVGGTYTPVGAALTIVAVGTYEIALSGTEIEQFDADAEFVRVNATLGGTTPSLTYQAYLTAA